MKTMNAPVIVYVDDTHAMVTKKFAKSARIFGTTEYKLWREYRKDFPEAEMMVKEIKKNPEKKTYRNMKYENMRTFILEQEDSEKMLDEFERQLKLSKIQSNPYRFVLAWFLAQYADSEDYFRSLPTQKKVATFVEVNN